jgi:hypothetical protein
MAKRKRTLVDTVRRLLRYSFEGQSLKGLTKTEQEIIGSEQMFDQLLVWIGRVGDGLCESCGEAKPVDDDGLCKKCKRLYKNSQ